MSVECSTISNTAARQFAQNLVNLDLPTAGDPHSGADEVPMNRHKSLFNGLPAPILQLVAPAAIALSAMFSGVHAVGAQEPTPPPENTSGIRTYCDRDASCFVTVIWPPGGAPADTGTVANALAASGIIDQEDAETCATAFERVHAYNLKPEPQGRRPTFPFSGMQFELPPPCTSNLQKEIPRNLLKPDQIVLSENSMSEQAYETTQNNILRECLGYIGLLAGGLGLADWRIRRKYRTKK